MKLIEYKGQKKLKKQISSYSLPENQAIFSGHPKDNVIEASKEDNKYPIVLVTNDEILTTYFILQEKEGVQTYSDNEHAILLRSFSTDSKYQGKGFAKMALKLLPEYVKRTFESINEIVLAVNSVNESAISLYRKCNFIDTTQRIKTEYGSLIILSQVIE